jgi:hypothetical protein
MCADIFHRHNTSEPDWKQIKLDLVTAMGRRHMLLGWKLPKERARSCRAELPALGWIKFAMVGGIYRWATWCIGEGVKIYHRDELNNALDNLLTGLREIHFRLGHGIGHLDRFA